MAAWAALYISYDPEHRMHARRAFDEAARHARMVEAPTVLVADAHAPPANMVDNLRWFVPLALDHDVALPVVVESAAPPGSELAG